MMRLMRPLWGLAVTTTVALAAVALAAPAARSRDYPERPVTIVVPFPPGGSVDVMARLLSERLSADLGQPIVVDNRPGASTAIGAQAVASAPKDGYTLFLTAASTFTTNPSLIRDLRYRLDDFTAVAVLATTPLVFVVRKDFPGQTFRDFVEYGRQNPDKLNNATAGAGNTVHFAAEMIARSAGIRLRHVHYRGTAPASTGIMSGVVDSGVEALGNAVVNVNAGLYRPMGILSEARTSQAPDIPTFVELGYPELIFSSWYALLAPAGTPPAVIEKLNSVSTGILAQADFVSRLRAIGNEPVPARSPAAAEAFIRSEAARWAKIVEETGIKLE